MLSSLPVARVSKIVNDVCPCLCGKLNFPTDTASLISSELKWWTPFTSWVITLIIFPASYRMESRIWGQGRNERVSLLLNEASRLRFWYAAETKECNAELLEQLTSCYLSTNHGIKLESKISYSAVRTFLFLAQPNKLNSNRICVFANLALNYHLYYNEYIFCFNNTTQLGTLNNKYLKATT